MNILYIGPYRQKDINGLTSLQILSYLIEKLGPSIRSAPLYLNHSLAEKVVPDYVVDAERRIIDNYDAIIQHANLDQLIKINKIKKNIAIPIIEAGCPTSESVDNLSVFDSILVDTKLAYNKLAKYNNIRNKLYTFNYNISSMNYNIVKSTYDTGVLQHSKKIYFLGQYQKNITNIANLCKSFVNNIKSNEYSLLLFLYGLDVSSKNNLENLIKQLYLNNNLKYTINRIITIPMEFNLSNLIGAHNTGDIFIDLQDDSSNSVNTKIATILNKTIVQYEADNLIFSFDRNNQSSLRGFEGVAEHHVNTSLRHIINGSNSYVSLPFKNKDIIQLL